MMSADDWRRVYWKGFFDDTFSWQMVYMKVVLARRRGTILPFMVLFLCSCMAPTGTPNSLSQTTLQAIKELGIVTTTKEEFSVRLSRHKPSNVGGALFGLVGAMAESGARSYSDGNREQELSRQRGNFDVAKVLDEKLYTHLESAKASKGQL